LFLIPFLVHLPVYVIALWGERFAEEEVEARAQNKIVFGLLAQAVVYPALAVLVYTSTSLNLFRTLLVIFLVAHVHVRWIDTNYEHYKRLMVAWRVFVCTLTPETWDLDEEQLRPFTVSVPPPPNPFVTTHRPTTPPPVAHSINPPRPPSRRIMRHIFRARAAAVKLLGDYLRALDSGTTIALKASAHLAATYGSGNCIIKDGDTRETSENAVSTLSLATSWRDAQEVLLFLKQRGAKFPDEAKVD